MHLRRLVMKYLEQQRRRGRAAKELVGQVNERRNVEDAKRREDGQHKYRRYWTDV
jgi:hypothetical protein